MAAVTLFAATAGCGADRGPGDGLAKVPDGVSIEHLRESAGDAGELLFASRSPRGPGVDVGLGYTLGNRTDKGRLIVALCRDGMLVKVVEPPPGWPRVRNDEGRLAPGDIGSAPARIADLWNQPSLPPDARRDLGWDDRSSSGENSIDVILLPLALPAFLVLSPLLLYEELATLGDHQHWRPDRVHVGDPAGTVRDLYGGPNDVFAGPGEVRLWFYRPPNDHHNKPVLPLVVGVSDGHVSQVISGSFANRLVGE